MIGQKLEYYLSKNDNSAEFNNWIYKDFSSEFLNTEVLCKHRYYIEENRLGFGDRAFHYMWLLLLDYIKEHTTKPKVLEIGVFKGQVISLWTLLAKELNFPIEIHAVSPFEGNYSAPSGRFQQLMHKINPFIRAKRKDGNLYEKEDYLQFIKNLFSQFDLDFNKIVLHKGYSTSPQILNEIKNDYFDLIYIDGDHSYNGCKSDILNFTPKIKHGGFLVMDDAGCNVPGGGEGIYWKGHASVSKACEIIPDLGFENVLNIGHNRIYRKT